MTKQEYQAIVKEALKVLSDPPPGKTKRTPLLVGLSEEDVLKAIEGLRAIWEVSSVARATRGAGTSSAKKAGASATKKAGASSAQNKAK